MDTFVWMVFNNNRFLDFFTQFYKYKFLPKRKMFDKTYSRNNL